MIQHVWFDFAGTLYKYSSDYKKIHDKLVYETYAKVVKQKYSKKLKQDYDRLYKKHKTNSRVFISLGKHPDFWAKTQEKLDKKKYIENQAGLKELFDCIRERKVKISLLTNALEGEVLETLGYLGLSSKDFDNLLTGEKIEKKPSLDGYYKAIELSKVEPEKILYVGDRIEGEILPAKKAGLKTALVWSTEKRSGADYTLRDINDVLEVLG